MIVHLVRQGVQAKAPRQPGEGREAAGTGAPGTCRRLLAKQWKANWSNIMPLRGADSMRMQSGKDRAGSGRYCGGAGP